MIAQRRPEWRKHVSVVDQRADRATELVEQGIVQLMIVIKLDQLTNELLDSFALAILEAEFAGIDRVESDPQKNLAGIGVFGFVLRACQPTDGAMDSYTVVFRLCVTNFPMLFLQFLRIHLDSDFYDSASQHLTW